MVMMRLTGHGTITDLLIVIGIMVGVALVATFIVRSLVYGEPATIAVVISPWVIQILPVMA
jgi:hypothetical protein